MYIYIYCIYRYTFHVVRIVRGQRCGRQRELKIECQRGGGRSTWKLSGIYRSQQERTLVRQKPSEWPYEQLDSSANFGRICSRRRRNHWHVIGWWWCHAVAPGFLISSAGFYVSAVRINHWRERQRYATLIDNK